MLSFLSALRGNKLNFFTPLPPSLVWVASEQSELRGKRAHPLQRTREPKFTARLYSLLSILELWGCGGLQFPPHWTALCCGKVDTKFLTSSDCNTFVVLQVSMRALAALLWSCFHPSSCKYRTKYSAKRSHSLIGTVIKSVVFLLVIVLLLWMKWSESTVILRGKHLGISWERCYFLSSIRRKWNISHCK